ncbi:B-cell receptor CD22-like isoform X2 [Oryzias latipes]|uniref:B-cell receptor CD22-like isoform X2 n=1 Tax=Oryzias latipes TaxID=8090 RepID=UPI000CE1E0E8|nr:B-cell receptor CD22-like isoform X2 [Oryzias latipes]
MSLTAALRGFVVVLCWFAGIHSQTWGVEYASKHICAFKGSTVEISCTYTYPPRISYKKTVVQREFWYAKLKDKNPLDLREDPDYAGRVTYRCSEQSCSLRISGLRLNDFAEYKFRFETNQPDGSFTGKPGVSLTVTDLQVLSQRKRECQSYPCALFELTCHSSCVLPHSSYVWYINGEIITAGSQQKYSTYLYAADSVSCAVRGHESFHSPAVCPRVQVIRSGLELVCHSSCFPRHHLSFVWFMNGQEVQGETSDYYRKPVSPEASYSCSYQGHRSPEVYAPKSVSVSMSLTEIMEGSSVTLTCSCDANPPAKFRWYKNNQTLLLEDQSLILRSVQRSDSRKFHCVAENELGELASDQVFINVEYPPETSSVSVSPSAEVLEGSSVTLTCSSDANPAAKYTWFKDNRTLLSEDKVHFSSIRSEHSGNYSCKSENKHGQSSSTPLLLDVQYPPRIPSVSKDEDSPKASGPNWTISDFRAEHSGFYYCEAENRRGSLNSSLHLIETETGSWKSAATAKTTFAVLLFVFIPAFLWIRKNRRVTEQQEKRAANRTQLNTSPDINSPSAETEAAEEQLELHYSSIHLSENQEECLYPNIRRNPKPRQRPEDNSVEYSAVGFKKSAEAKKTTEAEHSEDFAFYSTVNKVSS